MPNRPSPRGAPRMVRHMAALGPLVFMAMHSPECPAGIVRTALGELGYHHRNGAPHARHLANIICARRDAEVPEWLRESNGAAALDELNPYRARRTGRHATMKGFEADRIRRAYIFEALKQAKKRGYPKPRKAAIEVLSLFYGDKAPDERTVRAVEKHGDSIPGHLVGGWVVAASMDVSAAFDILEKK